MSTTPMDIKREADRAFSSTERTNQERLWEEIAEFVVPNQFNNFFGDDTPGQRKTRRLFDSVAGQAAQDLAASIHSTLTNPSTKWSVIKFKDKSLNDNEEAVAWLEAANNAIHSELASSNFDGAVAKAYQSITTFGSMMMLHEQDNVDETFDKFKFNTWHMSEVAFSENSNGIADRVFRKFKMTKRQIMEKWPDTFPKEWDQPQAKNLDEKQEIIHAIFPRDPREVRLNEFGLAPGKSRPFASMYILGNKSELLEEGGFYELPVYVVRWSTMPGEEYGRGPSHLALPDVRTLNKTKQLSLKAAAKAIDPPVLVTKRNLFGNFDIRPGRVTLVRDVNGFREMNTSARFDLTQFEVESLRNSIKSIYFIDKLMLPPRTETGEQTAFEVAERLAQMQKVLGPTLSRFNHEFLSPLIVRCFKILLREGILPPLPEVLLESGVDVAIRFVNPLSINQRQEELNNLSAWVGQASLLAQTTGDMGALDWVDSDFIVKFSADLRGIPEGAVKTSDQVEAEREARAQQAQQQQALEAGVKMADIESKIQGG